jgi:serine protease AprX
MNAKVTPNLNKITKVVIILAMLITIMVTPRAATSRQASHIVQGTNVEAVARLVKAYGGTITSRLDIINGVGAVLPASAVASLLAEEAITAVTPNATVKVAGNGNVPATDYGEVVGADITWGLGSTGIGVTVAVVDTGISNMRGLTKDIDGNNGRVVGWLDLVGGTTRVTDPNGHGSHVAGIIANTQIGADNEWDGVSPGVDLVGVRVLDANGFGTYDRVIQGIQWVIQNKDVYNIKVMNLSLVSAVQSPYWADPLNQAVMQAWAQGITVVVSAGNGGPGAMTIGVPGNNPYVITVGAFTDSYTPYDWNDDYLAPFSAAGPTLDGFAKPDVVAPGAHMVSTMQNSAVLATTYAANRVGTQYFSMAGTSQAAAVVSGIAALTLSYNPNLTPDQVKYRILVTAFPWVDTNTTEALYSIWQQGAGRVNAPDAVTADISGAANVGMDIAADLAGTAHYEGFSYYDETTGLFRLRGDFNEWNGGYWAWNGGFGTWSGGFGTWSGGFGTWSGGFGTWSGGFGTWSGGFGTWSGGFGTWSGGFGTWSGGFGTWSGGFGTWSGSEPWAGSLYADPVFVQNFLNGVSPNLSSSITSINSWVNEP